MELLRKTTAEISDLDEKIMEKAQKRINSLTKPPGSLGMLEEIAVKLAGMQGQVCPEVEEKTHLLFAADHGVAEENVSAVPQSITEQMVYNFLEGGAAINVLCRQAQARLQIIDIGVKTEINHPDVINSRIKSGTENIAIEPAMSREEAVQAINTGIELALSAVEEGASLLSTGEMGIANTTPSSAIVAAMTDKEVAAVVGYGSGISEEQRQHKISIVEKALEVNKPDPDDAVDVLAKVGGLEIAGMAGVMIGAASRSVPIIMDGFIAGAAAIIACNIEPQIADYIIPSHKSAEPGHEDIFDFLDLSPAIDMNMRLGEGSGAVLHMHNVEAACRIMADMATFAEAGIELG